jgi:SAM-dependent methyltransferase
VIRLLGIRGDGEGARVVEFGSGTGEFADEFCRRYPGAAYLGLDLSQTGVEISRRRVPGGNFFQRDLLQPRDSDPWFGFRATHAICSEVLEHLDEPRVFLRSALAYLSPGCKLIVTVPSGPMCAFYQVIGHRRHYTSREMSGLLQSAGFRIEKAYDAGFPFFNLFRLFISWRGDKLMESIAGPPSPAVRIASWLLDLLFRLNLKRWGWQTVVVARCPGR